MAETFISLARDYPELKEELLTLAYLKDQLDRVKNKSDTGKNELEAAAPPPADVPERSTTLNQQAANLEDQIQQYQRNMSQDRMVSFQRKTAHGAVANSRDDVRCLAVIKELGHFSGEVLYDPDGPERLGIIDEAERRNMQRKEARIFTLTEEENRRINEIEEAEARERKRPRHNPFDSWMSKKDRDYDD